MSLRGFCSFFEKKEAETLITGRAGYLTPSPTRKATGAQYTPLRIESRHITKNVAIILF